MTYTAAVRIRRTKDTIARLMLAARLAECQRQFRIMRGTYPA